MSEGEKLIDWAAYDHLNGGCYWTKTDADIWIKVSQKDLLLRLKRKQGGLPSHDNQKLTSTEKFILNIQEHMSVEYAGPLAGHWAGIHVVSNQRILVTASPHLINPVEGEWSTLHRFLLELLGDDQAPYFFGWLSQALTCLYHKEIRPGQSLILAGPAGSGKSLMQKLITYLLGGRAGKPFRYMTGKTQFNGDFFESEHLVIEDELTSKIHRDKLLLAENIKAVAANNEHSCHRKQRQAITLTPFLALNN